MTRASGLSLVWVLALAMLVVPVSAQQEITYWVWGWPQESQGGIDAAIALFEELHPDVKVTKRVGVNLDQLATATAAGVPPDLVLGTSGFYESMLLLDGLEPLDAYFAATGLWEKLLPGLEMTAQFRGVEYGVPGVALYPLDGLVWNKTMFAEGGIQPLPEDRSITWTELVELARKLVVRSADDNLVRIGYHPLEGRNSNPDVLETYFDLTLIADGEPRLNSAEVARALDFLNDNFVLGQARSAEEFHEAMPAGWYLIGRQQTAMANLGAYAPAELGRQAPEHDFGVTWHPTWDGTRKQQVTTFINMIPKGAKHIDAAWKLAEFLATSPEAQTLIFGTTGFFGPSREFIQGSRFDDPLTRWYIASLSHAESVRFEKHNPYGEGVPNVWNHLVRARNAVLIDQEPSSIALERANDEWRAEIVRAMED